MKTRISIIIVALIFGFSAISRADVEGYYTPTIRAGNKDIELKNGIDLSHHGLDGNYIDRQGEKLKNIKFDRAYFERVKIWFTTFENW